MMFFKKRSAKKICLCKQVELAKTSTGSKTTYFTEIDGCYVKNSLSFTREEGEAFFESVLKANGVTQVKEILRTDHINQL